MPHINEIISLPFEDRLAYLRQQPLPEKPALQCEHCDDFGRVLGRDGKTHDCPNPDCAAARANRAKRLANTFKYHNWTLEQLQCFTFESFADMPHKELAVGACHLFMDGKPFTLAQAASYWGVTMTAHHESNWLTLWGDNGTGKTSLMAATANAIRANGKQAIMIRYENLYARIKETYGESDETENSIISAVSQAEFLLIDELTVPTPITANSISVLSRIVDYRNSKGLPTMFTMNWGEDDLIRNWGRIIGSRILTGHFIKLEGAILRPRSHSVSSSLRG
jgi:hypothetical protein